MILFVDASALVAIMTKEPGALELERHFGAADDKLCSPVSVWETTRAIARKRTVPVAIALADVEAFMADFAIRLVPIGDAEARGAVSAHDRYGKGSGHPARLNTGDCFAYACAKANGADLLYKGDDFSLTDLA